MTRGTMGKRKGIPPTITRESAVHEGPTDRDGLPEVGRVLRRAREHFGLSLREVERRIGKSNAYLSQVERGLIRQPDPVLLLELAELYGLDFMTLATWAGWTNAEREQGRDGSRADSATLLVRRILSLNETQRMQVQSYIDEILRAHRT